MEPIRLVRDTRGIHAALRAVLPSDAADGIIRGIKYLHNPQQSTVRSGAARDLRADADEAEQLRREGYLRFAPGRFPDADAAIAEAEGLFETRAQAGELEALRACAMKDFKVNIATDCEFVASPAILRFAVSRPLIDLAAAYLGRVPLLTGIALWWSPVNDSMTKSQLYHRDAIDRNQLKLMFNVRDIGADTGPFTLIPATESARVMKALGYSTGKLADEAIDKVGGLEHAIPFTGPRGAGACCDTSRCLHFGSRGNRRDRLILMIQFVDYLAPRYDLPRWHAHVDDRSFPLDGVQRLVLGVQ